MKSQMSFSQVQKNKQHSQSTKSSFSIFVTPLPQDIKEQDLRFLFSLFGRITLVKIIKKPQPQNHCYGFVNFSSFEAKQKAKKFSNGKMLGWKSLTVQDSKEYPTKDKKTQQNWQNQTFYEENSQTYQSRPKKKVHLHERKIIIDQSFENKNSSKSYRSPLPLKKSIPNYKFKESFNHSKNNPSPKKWNQKSRKGHSSCFNNKKQNSKEIDY